MPRIDQVAVEAPDPDAAPAFSTIPGAGGSRTAAATIRAGRDVQSARCVPPHAVEEQRVEAIRELVGVPAGGEPRIRPVRG